MERKLYDIMTLKGKKAMLSFTTDANKDVYSYENPHGDLDEIFRHITHNILELTGLEIMPSFVVYGSVVMFKEDLNEEMEKFKQIINSL